MNKAMYEALVVNKTSMLKKTISEMNKSNLERKASKEHPSAPSKTIAFHKKGEHKTQSSINLASGFTSG